MNKKEKQKYNKHLKKTAALQLEINKIKAYGKDLFPKIGDSYSAAFDILKMTPISRRVLANCEFDSIGFNRGARVRKQNHLEYYQLALSIISSKLYWGLPANASFDFNDKVNRVFLFGTISQVEFYFKSIIEETKKWGQ